MYGKGLLEGLKITLGNFFGKTITQKYPEVKPNLPKSTHCFFDFKKEKCIACGICANSCPNNVIKIETVRDENNKRKLKSYKMEISYCLFCGLCVESCPTNAIEFNQDFELACYKRDDTEYSFYEEDMADDYYEKKVVNK